MLSKYKGGSEMKKGTKIILGALGIIIIGGAVAGNSEKNNLRNRRKAASFHRQNNC